MFKVIKQIPVFVRLHFQCQYFLNTMRENNFFIKHFYLENNILFNN